jgi:hypothetical protein
LKPFKLRTVIVKEPVTPRVTDWLVGETVIEKSGGGPVKLSVYTTVPPEDKFCTDDGVTLARVPGPPPSEVSRY